MIWHFLVGKDGLLSFPTTTKSSFKWLSDCTQWQRRCIQSQVSCTSAHKCWTGKPSPAIQLSLPSSSLCSTCFSIVLFLLDLQSFIWKQGGKELLWLPRFKQKGSKPKGNSHCKVCHTLLPSHPVALTQPLLSTFDWQQIFRHFWSPPFQPDNSQCHPSSTTVAGKKPADQLSPTSPLTRCLLSLSLRASPQFLELKQRWNLLHLQAINPFYRPEPSIDGNSCVAVFP